MLGPWRQPGTPLGQRPIQKRTPAVAGKQIEHCVVSGVLVWQAQQPPAVSDAAPQLRELVRPRSQ